MQLGSLLCLTSTLLWAILACDCQNGGKCQTSPLSTHCSCLPGYLGSRCEIAGRQLVEDPVTAHLGNDTAFFYYSPQLPTLHSLNMTFCSPQAASVMMFQTTENFDRSIPDPPPIHQVYKLNFEMSECISWNTHHISQKSPDGLIRKMIVGLKMVKKDQKLQYLLELPAIWNLDHSKPPKSRSKGSSEWVEISVQMDVDFYKPSNRNYDGIALMAMGVFMLVMVVAAFLMFVKTRFTPPAIDNTPYEFMERVLQEELREHQRRARITRQRAMRQSRRRMENLMPVQVWGEEEGRLQDNTCSICLLTLSGEVRVTPCQHAYHRECIDEWFRSKPDCPICRRTLDPAIEVQKLIQRMLSEEF